MVITSRPEIGPKMKLQAIISDVKKSAREKEKKLPLKLKCSTVVQHVKVSEITRTMPWMRSKQITPVKNKEGRITFYKARAKGETDGGFP